MDFCCPPQLTDEVKKEKEKEPEKTEKQEITSYKKKFLEEKKDSDDSDEVTCPGSWSAQVYSGMFCVFYIKYHHLFLFSQETKPDVPKLSKKKLRRMNRLTVAELKQVSQTNSPLHMAHTCPFHIDP